MNGKQKSKFRRTKAWTELKRKVDKLQPVDQLTHSKLTKRHQLHHMDLDPSHYTDLSNIEHFRNLNPESHKVLHWFYSRYVKDPLILDRLHELLAAMYVINNGKDIRDFKTKGDKNNE